MQMVILSIVFYIVLGGIGMYFGSRKVDAATAKQRWLKYVSYILITSIIVLSIWFWFFMPFALLIVLAGYYELIRTLRPGRSSRIALVFYSFMAAGFVLFSLQFTKEFQFFIYFQILAFDAFSQVTGQLIGKTPITPGISPSKTLEGFLGGVFFCVLSAVLAANWVTVSIIASVLLGLFTAATGFAGDILASFYKRISAIKDYSNLLPGQGGFLDRFDSFIMTGFCYTVIYFVAPNIFPA